MFFCVRPVCSPSGKSHTEKSWEALMKNIPSDMNSVPLHPQNQHLTISLSTIDPGTAFIPNEKGPLTQESTVFSLSSG